MTTKRLDCSLEDYRKDRVFAGPSLNASIAHILWSESPLHAWQVHPRLGGLPADEDDEPEQLKAKIHGSLIHKLLLGKGADIAIVEAADWRTNAAKDARDVALSSGQIPCLRHKLDLAQLASERITERLEAQGVVLDGESEVMLGWSEPIEPIQGKAAGQEIASIACRGQLDHLTNNQFSKNNSGAVPGWTTWDVKTCKSANPRFCVKVAEDKGLIQMAAYVSAVEKMGPALVGRVDFAWLFVETSPPYDVLVARPSESQKEAGRRRWAKAVELWARCIACNVSIPGGLSSSGGVQCWPGYSNGPVTLESSQWILRELGDIDG